MPPASVLSSRPPAGALKLSRTILTPTTKPPLWWESNVIWAVPCFYVAPPYVVAYCILDATVAQLSNLPKCESSGAVADRAYKPPFTYNDAPGWSFSEMVHGKQEFFLFLSCLRSTMPFVGQILSSLGVKVPTTVGPAYPGLGPTCVAQSTSGPKTVNARYIVAVPNTSKPWDAVFPAPNLGN